MRIYIDIDDTVAEYSKSMLGKMEEYPQSVPGFFTALPLKEGAFDAISALRADGHQVNFATRPSYKNLHCFTEKAEWTLDKFGYDLYTSLIIIGDKSLLIGDILVDDHHEAGQPDFKGIWIKFGSTECPDWAAATEIIDCVPAAMATEPTSVADVVSSVDSAVLAMDYHAAEVTIYQAVATSVHTLDYEACASVLGRTNIMSSDRLSGPRRLAASVMRQIMTQQGATQHEIGLMFRQRDI